MAAGWLEGLGSKQQAAEGDAVGWVTWAVVAKALVAKIFNYRGWGASKGSSEQNKIDSRKSWRAADCMCFQQPQACRGVDVWLCYGSMRACRN